jgi:Txe/YoeB family toxin of Txe-Axe toxin-antitoxin module
LVVSQWELVWTPTFTSLYRSKDNKLKQRTKDLIDLLAQAQNPLRYGEKLINLGYYAARISKGDRLGYTVEGKKIILLKVCDHKVVEGKD